MSRRRDTRVSLAPSLSVSWHDDETNQTTRAEFIQKTKSTDPYATNVNDWAQLIEDTSKTKIREIQSQSSKEYGVDKNTLEAKVLAVLEEMQWKGLFQIEKELAQKDFEETNFDFEEIESACKKLVEQKLIERDETGEFYRLRSHPASDFWMSDWWMLSSCERIVLV